MAMGYVGGYADTILDEDLEKLVPNEFRRYRECLDKIRGLVEEHEILEIAQLRDEDTVDLETAFDSYLLGDDETDEGDRNKLLNFYHSYVALSDAFSQATSVGRPGSSSGLKLYLQQHDSDSEGSVYDDVDGLYFDVEGVYQLTTAGKKFKDIVHRSFFVTYLG